MSFLFPGFLWALLFLAIPVIVHLFNFRRYKKIFFTNVKFLKSVTEQTKSGNRLKKLLILCCRLLALAFLVFAFAQPFIPDKDIKKEKGSKAVSIYIDNSYSMNGEGAEGQLFEAAKNRARAIVNSYSNTDKFQVFTNDLDGASLHFITKENCLESIDKFKLSAATRTLSEIVAVQNKSLHEQSAENKIAFMVTDFQKSIADLKAKDRDSLVAYRLVQVKANPTDNLSIDSCWFSSPVMQASQPQELVVRVKNYGDEEVNDIPVELEVNGRKKGLATVSVPAGGESNVSITFTQNEPGFHKAVLSLSGDKITYDDKLYASFHLKDQIRVLAISQSLPEKFIHAVFALAPGYQLTEQQQSSIQYSAFKNNDLVVLNGLTDFSSGLCEELKHYTEAGGNIMLIPAADRKPESSTKFFNTFSIPAFSSYVELDQKVSQLEREHPLFGNVFQKIPRNLDLPAVSAYYKMAAAGGVPVMRMQNGDPFMNSYQRGKGYVFVCAVPLDDAFSNFRSHALFVPLMLRSSLVKTYTEHLYYSARQTDFVPVDAVTEGNKNYVLKNGKTELVPELLYRDNHTEMNTNGEVEEAGHYDLLERNENKAIATVAFNADRRESDTRFLDDAGIAGQVEALDAKWFSEGQESFAKLVEHAEKGTPLWKWCIILTLLFLAIEILLIRFFKV